MNKKKARSLSIPYIQSHSCKLYLKLPVAYYQYITHLAALMNAGVKVKVWWGSDNAVPHVHAYLLLPPLFFTYSYIYIHTERTEKTTQQYHRDCRHYFTASLLMYIKRGLSWPSYAFPSPIATSSFCSCFFSSSHSPSHSHTHIHKHTQHPPEKAQATQQA